MSPSEVIVGWMEHVWNNKETEYIHQHMSNPCDVTGIAESACTPDGFAEFRNGMIASIPDMHIEVEKVVEQGDEAAGTCRITGTHLASKRPVDFHFGFTVTVREDKIVAARNVVDFLTMLQQVEAVDGDALEKCL